MPPATSFAIYSTYSYHTNVPLSVSAEHNPRSFWTYLYFSWVSDDGIALSNWLNLAEADGSVIDPDWEETGPNVPIVAEAGTNGKKYHCLASTGDYVFSSISTTGQADSIFLISYDITQKQWHEVAAVGTIEGW